MRPRITWLAVMLLLSCGSPPDDEFTDEFIDAYAQCYNVVMYNPVRTAIDRLTKVHEREIRASFEQAYARVSTNRAYSQLVMTFGNDTTMVVSSLMGYWVDFTFPTERYNTFLTILQYGNQKFSFEAPGYFTETFTDTTHSPPYDALTSWKLSVRCDNGVTYIHEYDEEPWKYKASISFRNAPLVDTIKHQHSFIVETKQRTLTVQREFFEDQGLYDEGPAPYLTMYTQDFPQYGRAQRYCEKGRCQGPKDWVGFNGRRIFDYLATHPLIESSFYYGETLKKIIAETSKEHHVQLEGTLP